MKEQHSPTFLRKRRFLLALPMLIVPFLSLAFWALGGGKGTSLQAATVNNLTGLNMDLPGAHLKDDRAIDKLGYYEKADDDSSKLREQIKNDPYFNKDISFPDTEEELIDSEEVATSIHQTRKGLKTSPYFSDKDPNEEKVYAKLQKLNEALNDAANPGIQPKESYSPDRSVPAMNTQDVDRLEQMMQMMGKGDKESDPEMEQLNGVLNKILDIQHPERAREEMKGTSADKQDEFLMVSTTNKADTIISGFYSLENDTSSIQVSNTIEAVVHNNQTLVSGGIVKMRLLKDLFIGTNRIASGSFVFGIATLNNERLNIQINTIRSGNSLYPVKLEVYDADGLSGIHIPGNISRDVIKQSTDNSLSSVGLSSLDPSIAAQATATGINTAKSLLSKKVKLVRVTVKAGYKIFLQNKTITK